jgi:hypothetical protein
MGLTVEINGLSLCHKGSSGISAATIPDVCKTPTPGGPVPIPYPNIAKSADLANGTTTIHADSGNMCANYGSEFAVSLGDAPGSLGGVTSGTFIKEATWITYSFDVKLEGKGACRLTDKMFHNHQNTVDMGGEFQGIVGAVGLDNTMQALCEVFCQAKKEGIDFKKANPKGRFDYSQRAKQLAEKHPSLKAMSFERKLFTALDNANTKLVDLAKKAGRQAWGAEAIKKRLAKEFAERAAVKLGKKVVQKAVLKFIPVVNVISIALDVYDVAKLGVEAYNMASQAMQAYDPSKFTTFEIRPDVSMVDADGKVTEIYDFKFDRPPMTSDDGRSLGSYKDKMPEDQRQLYDEKLRQGGSKNTAKVVDQRRCQCK